MEQCGDEFESLPAGQAVRAVGVTRWRGAQPAVVQDVLAEEVPVALVYNGISHVVMLATPADLEDFAYGFSFTEGIVDHPQQIYGVELQAVYEAGRLQGIEVHITLAAAQFVRLKERRRNLTGRTGCGLCGAESLQQVFKQPVQPVSQVPRLAAGVIDAALAALPPWQPLQQSTGATHACALVGEQGEILDVREDVGRHNALDKLLGALLRRQSEGALLDRQWILSTSRASYEMVQKVAMLGGRALVAMSAPTALAVDLAKTYDMLLVGFARTAQCVAYQGCLYTDSQ